MIYKLENTIQRYAWGSATLLPEFLGLPNPGKEPWAELWMGAHPKAPSLAAAGGKAVPLDALAASDPAAFLGEEVVRRFGPRLPFLFKVLAAGSPLSIQCHPDRQQAREGFERENRRGIPLDAPNRNYRDPSHKPEIILAVSEFTALRGFRPAEETAGFFAALPVPELRAAGRALAGDGGGAEDSGGLRAFLKTLLGASREKARLWIGSCLEAALPGTEPERSWFRRLAADYPGDSGCFAPFYLNLVTLHPGEAMALAAGEPHAYLEGLGVELMANSDNVLRGGLTSKHVDREELFRVLDFRAGPARILRPRSRMAGDGIVEDEYPPEGRTGTEEFALSVLRSGDPAGGEGGVPRARLESGGPEILLCGGGSAKIAGRENSRVFARGEAVFVPASEGSCTVEGGFVLYRARVSS